MSLPIAPLLSIALPVLQWIQTRTVSNDSDRMHNVLSLAHCLYQILKNIRKCRYHPLIYWSCLWRSQPEARANVYLEVFIKCIAIVSFPDHFSPHRRLGARLVLSKLIITRLVLQMLNEQILFPDPKRGPTVQCTFGFWERDYYFKASCLASSEYIVFPIPHICWCKLHFCGVDSWSQSHNHKLSALILYCKQTKRLK